MRYMMIMMPTGKQKTDYEKAAPGALPDSQAMQAMMKYNESLQKAGVLLALDGLHSPNVGARIRFTGGAPRVTDGPFPESKEAVGGYWMIRVKSREEAIKWAKRCPASPDEMIEVRRVYEPEDFGQDMAARERGLLDKPKH